MHAADDVECRFIEVFGDQGGVDESRPDGIDPYAVLGVFHGRHLGQPYHAVLGRHVGGRRGKADGAQDGCHVDNGTPARGHDGRNLVP